MLASVRGESCKGEKRGGGEEYKVRCRVVVFGFRAGQTMRRVHVV